MGKVHRVTAAAVLGVIAVIGLIFFVGLYFIVIKNKNDAVDCKDEKQVQNELCLELGPSFQKCSDKTTRVKNCLENFPEQTRKDQYNSDFQKQCYFKAMKKWSFETAVYDFQTVATILSRKCALKFDNFTFSYIQTMTDSLRTEKICTDEKDPNSVCLTKIRKDKIKSALQKYTCNGEIHIRKPFEEIGAQIKVTQLVIEIIKAFENDKMLDKCKGDALGTLAKNEAEMTCNAVLLEHGVVAEHIPNLFVAMESVMSVDYSVFESISNAKNVMNVLKNAVEDRANVGVFKFYLRGLFFRALEIAAKSKNKRDLALKYSEAIYGQDFPKNYLLVMDEDDPLKEMYPTC